MAFRLSATKGGKILQQRRKKPARKEERNFLRTYLVNLLLNLVVGLTSPKWTRRLGSLPTPVSSVAGHAGPSRTRFSNPRHPAHWIRTRRSTNSANSTAAGAGPTQSGGCCGSGGAAKRWTMRGSRHDPAAGVEVRFRG